jgi:hypothetical protein
MHDELAPHVLRYLALYREVRGGEIVNVPVHEVDIVGFLQIPNDDQPEKAGKARTE